MRRLATLIVGLGLLLGVTACASGPASAPRTTATQRPSATAAEPAASAAAVAPVSDIVILPDGVRFQVGASARETIAYDAPVDVALAAFADALGPQTGSEAYSATNHTPAGTKHRFGSGVAVFEPHYEGAVEIDPVVRPAWWIRADTAEAGDVHVATSGGIAVGSPVGDIPGWNDPDRMGTVITSAGTMAELLVSAAPGFELVPSAEAGAYGVLAIANPYPGAITTLVAPSQHGGA